MKPFLNSLLLSLLLSFITASASAQIRDDEPSQAVLAVQCAVSSGFSASDFEDYSRRLAKTLSLLTPTQQKKVFGYLPQPSGFSADYWKEAEVAPIVASADRNEVRNSDPGLLVGLVGDLNNALNGSAQTSTAVYAGEPAPGSTVSAIANGKTSQSIEEAAEAIAGSRTSKSWDAIVTWLTALAEKARLK